jgi:hypothetical protein
VEAEVERLVEVDEVAEPIGVDVSRIFGERENPNVAAVHKQLCPLCLDRRGGDEIRKRPRTELKPLLRSRGTSSVAVTPQAIKDFKHR